MPVQAITAITIIIPGETVEGTVEWDSMEDMEEVGTGAGAGAEVIVEGAEEAGVIPEEAEEVETEAEDDTFQESRNLKNT